MPKLLDRRHQHLFFTSVRPPVFCGYFGLVVITKERAMDTPIECIKWKPNRSKRTIQDEFRERVNSKFGLTLGEAGSQAGDMPGKFAGHRECWRELWP